MNKCWAKSLNNCSSKITGEHIVSNLILDKYVTVKGFSWCKNESKTIGSSSLVGNILCNKHNEALSAYDNEAKKYLDTIVEFDKIHSKFIKFGFRKKDIPIIYNINGFFLERWFCKTIINLAFIENEEIKIHYDQILPILFHNEFFQKPFGLNFAVKAGQEVNTGKFLEIAPLYNELENGIKELAGGIFIFKGIHTIILLPHSKPPILNNQLLLNLSPNLIPFWTNLQLNWHNSKILNSIFRDQKEHLIQKIKINW